MNFLEGQELTAAMLTKEAQASNHERAALQGVSMFTLLTAPPSL